ncbi:hypothetical protein ABPG72_016265 [Tetrahymena utriculariae]
MGYLGNDGQTLAFEESLKYKDQIKRDGIIQFLNLYKKFKNITYKETIKNIVYEKYLPIHWGDEVEAHIVFLDKESKVPKIVPDIHYLFQRVQQDQQEEPEDVNFKLVPEYGGWMIETTPSNPYYTINNLCAVPTNLSERSHKINSYLNSGQKVLYTSTFPILGQIDQKYYYIPQAQNNEHLNQVTQSLFIDDRIISDHPRFPTLSSNIRTRRQEKVNIRVPIFKDKQTNIEVSQYNPDPDFIYMDAMAFGMGSSCIQTTFSAKNLSHARRLYDQMSIISPLFLAMTASSPIFRGKLAAIDTRWDVIAASVDCRSPEERNPSSSKYIPKSRYDSISFYISDEKRNLPQYNDLKFPLNEEIMNFAREKSKEMGLELDENYIRHLGFLYIRDPLVLFEKKLNVDNEKETLHFENIQSTNWNSVRLKPPPSMDSKIGWRTEFRTMECQITNDENAAFMLLSHIFVRLFYQSDSLNFYIPITKVDINFQRAKQVDAITTQKFFFRTNIHEDGEPIIEELTLHEIFFGKSQVFDGLYQYASQVWESMMQEIFGSNGNNDKTEFEKVWNFIRQRTSGQKFTVARWIRNFVKSHPEYKQDSEITNSIAYDLIEAITSISEGKTQDPNFTPIF